MSNSKTYYALKRAERARAKTNEQRAADAEAAAAPAEPEESFRDLQRRASAMGVSARGTREEIEAAIAAGPPAEDEDES